MGTHKNAHSPINAIVGYSATSVTLFGLSQGAQYRSVMNDTDKAAYVYFSASVASTNAFTKKLAAGEFWAFPEPVYNNQCTIIGEAAGTGSYRTTQY
jgi:hypothetical protein